MAVGVFCRKSELSIFGLVEAERCQLEFSQLCAGTSCDFGRALCRKDSLGIFDLVVMALGAL